MRSNILLGATFVGLELVGCGGSGDDDKEVSSKPQRSTTVEIDCYDIMNTTVITELRETQRNDYNFERCQQPGQENTVLVWDK